MLCGVKNILEFFWFLFELSIEFKEFSFLSSLSQLFCCLFVCLFVCGSSPMAGYHIFLAEQKNISYNLTIFYYCLLFVFGMHATYYYYADTVPILSKPFCLVILIKPSENYLIGIDLSLLCCNLVNKDFPPHFFKIKVNNIYDSVI